MVLDVVTSGLPFDGSWQRGSEYDQDVQKAALVSLVPAVSEDRNLPD